MRGANSVRAAAFLAAGAALLAPAGATLANGVIDVTGATVAAGNAPQPGAVVVEPAAPAATQPALPSLGTLGALGPKAGTVPEFPGAGSGGTSFIATESVSLPGGTYEYLSYDVLAGVTVSYEGAVTIRTVHHTGISGNVATLAAGADVTFHCGGEFRLGGASGGTVLAAGADADVAIDVAGALVTPADGDPVAAEVRSVSGDLELIARGGDTGFSIDLRRVSLHGAQVDVVSASGIRSDGGSFAAVDGLRFDAFGGDVEIGFGEGEASAGPLAVEASGAVKLARALLRARGGDDVSITAFGGDATLTDGGYAYAYDGADLRIRASGGVFLEDGVIALVNDGAGTLELTAFGGDVRLRPSSAAPQGQASGASTRHQGTGPTVVTASGGIASDGILASFAGGDVTVRALGGDVVLAAWSETSTSGALDAGASGVVRCGDLTAGATLRGGSVRASGSQVRLHGSSVLAETGAASLLGRLFVAASGPVQGATGVSIVSADGGITLDGATVTTTSSNGDRSGDVAVLSFGGEGCVVSARNATIRSGDHATASGDVSLRIHTPFAPTVAAYLLPSSVGVRLGAVRGAGCKVSGTFGLPGGWTLGEDGEHVPFELRVGSFVRTGLLGAPGGRTFQHVSEGLQVKVVPPVAGSSEGTFSARIDGDLSGVVPADGPLILRLTLNGTDAAATVVLAGGRFKLGKGEVLEPGLYPVSVLAKVRGGGRDALTLSLGFAAPDDAPPPAMAPLALGFGGWAATIDAAHFRAAGPGRFVARRPPSAPGIASVTVDFAKGAAVVKATALDLGAFATVSPVPVGVLLGLDPADVRSLDLLLARRGMKLTY